MIDPRAVVHPRAHLDAGVELAPYAVIGADVWIGSGTSVGPHAVVNGPTRIGRDNRIFQFASVGDAPQDKKYGGEPTRLEIGDRNVIREYATLHRGTVQDAGVTRVGDDNLFMAYSHVAHDCRVGNDTVFSNAASLAGHVSVHDHAILSGFTIVHQRTRIGTHCFCAMGSVISRDVPPFVRVSGHPARPHGINVEGLRRHDFGLEAIQDVRRAYKILYKCRNTVAETIAALRELGTRTPQVLTLVDFLDQSDRSIIR